MLAAGGGGGDASVVIAKRTVHPDRAIRQLDYWYSDEFQKLLWFGREGQDYYSDDRGNRVYYDKTNCGIVSSWRPG